MLINQDLKHRLGAILSKCHCQDVIHAEIANQTHQSAWERSAVVIMFPIGLLVPKRLLRMGVRKVVGGWWLVGGSLAQSLTQN